MFYLTDQKDCGQPGDLPVVALFVISQCDECAFSPAAAKTIRQCSNSSMRQTSISTARSGA